VSWSLTDQSTGGAVPDVHLVDSYAAQAAGDDPSIMWNNAVMIPPVLQPGTVYDGQARFTGDSGACVAETFAFATLQSDGSPPGVTVPRMSARSCSTVKTVNRSSPLAAPHVHARWRHGRFVFRAALARGERLVVRVHGRVHRTRRPTLRVHGRYSRTVFAWVTRRGHSSRHVRVRVRRA
jgi:hypothetical protein